MRILVVEDSNVSLKLMSSILTKHEYEVETASTGKEAVSVLESQAHIDIMRKCIHKIESAGKAGRTKKYKMSKALFRKWDKREEGMFDLDEINDYEPPDFD